MTQTKSNIKKQDTGGAAVAEHTRDVPVYIPATDIYETAEAVMVVADMPGVDKSQIDINLENNVLTITATREETHPENGQLLYGGYTPGDYKRSFTLTEEVDREGIKANIKDGVLRITIPKAKELQPRKIAVESGE